MDSQKKPAPQSTEREPAAQRPASNVRDRSSANTGSSIFDKADAGNRRLGRRNHT